jgi:photosystem II stability/assembly factor-like uncharacterized protein
MEILICPAKGNALILPGFNRETKGMLQLLRYNSVISFLLFCLVCSACKKESIAPGHEKITINSGKDLRAVYFTGPMTGFVAGGKFEKEGYIYRTADGGATWENVYTTHWSVNDIRFLDDETGYACGDSLHIIRTTDQGTNWTDVPLSWYPYEQHIVPLKHITFADDTTWYFTGGRYYQYGINVRTMNGGYHWDNMVFEVELNTAYFSDGQHGLLGGYGLILMTSDGNETFTPNDFKGDNITGMCFMDPENGAACGFDGGIYGTQDGGISWHTWMKPNATFGPRIHFNAIEYDAKGCMAVGNDGVAYHSDDAGDSWTAIDLNISNHFNDVMLHDDHFIIVGEDGLLVKIYL